MKKTRKKVLFGLTILTLVTVLVKPVIRISKSNNSNIICSNQNEPDNYEGVGILGFNGGSIICLF